MSIQERIINYIDLKGITPYKFCKSLGFSMGYLDKRGAIGTDKYLKIIKHYNDINPEWLLTGNGEMLLTYTKLYKNKPVEEIEVDQKTIDALTDNSNNAPSQDNSALFRDLLSTIQEQSRTIGRMEIQIASLQEQINNLTPQHNSVACCA